MRPFEWVNPTTIEEVVAHSADPTKAAVIKAGGIDLMDMLKERLIEPSRLINLRTVPGLEKLTESGDGLALGPLVTLARLAQDPVVRRRYRVLAEAAEHAATPQVRNVATLGGNLLQRPRCWYFRAESFHCLRKGGSECFARSELGENAYHAVFMNDRCAIVHPSATATALVALGASLEITGQDGARKVPIESFFVAPHDDVHRENTLKKGEVVTEILVPAPRASTVSAYAKQGEKESFDWPLAEVAVVLEMNSATGCSKASVILGAAAPIPYRARGAEALLVERGVTGETAALAARAAIHGATPLAQNAYKLPIFEAVVRRTILAAKAGLETRQGALR